jgi:hypothetical protein
MISKRIFGRNVTIMIRSVIIIVDIFTSLDIVIIECFVIIIIIIMVNKKLHLHEQQSLYQVCYLRIHRNYHLAVLCHPQRDVYPALFL